MRLDEVDSYVIRKKYGNHYMKFVQKIQRLSDVSLLIKFCLSIPATVCFSSHFRYSFVTKIHWRIEFI